MGGIYEKANPIRSKEGEKARKKWAAKCDYCQACGISRENAPRRDGGVPMAVHHVIRGSRSDEPTNWMMLCHRCHGLVHDDVYRDVDGQELPRLTLGIILTLKQDRCPKEYDRARLEQLYGATLPDELPIPEFLEREWSEYRGKKRLPSLHIHPAAKDKAKEVEKKAKEVEKKPKGKLKCKRCIRLNLDIKCGNCDAVNGY